MCRGINFKNPIQMKSRDGLYVPLQFKKKKDILNIRTNIKKKTRTNTKNRLNDFIYHANDLLNSNSFLVLNS